MTLNLTQLRTMLLGRTTSVEAINPVELRDGAIWSVG